MNLNIRFWTSLCLLALTTVLSAQEDTTNATQYIKIKDYTIAVSNQQLFFDSPGANGPYQLTINEEPVELFFQDGRAPYAAAVTKAGSLLLMHTAETSYRLYHISQGKQGIRLRHLPMWLSLLPPLIAILLALLFKEVIVSLFVGVWMGAFIAGGLRVESLYYFLLSFLQVIQKYVINALNDSGHLSVVVFSILIGGMVAVISRNGGMAGVVLALSRLARSARSAQFTTWLLGVAIFFDDYANTLIVGNTMRSVTDRFKISREKLAYLVDSTAAPVAAVAFITTWIGAELGYIDDGIQLLTNFPGDHTPYALFIQSLKYSFYPIFTLIFMLMLIYSGRDFGKMWHAERRARSTGQVQAPAGPEEAAEAVEDLSPVKGAPLKWRNAVIPVSLVILVTIFGLLDTGIASTFAEMQEAGLAVVQGSWGEVWRNLGGLLPGEQPGFFLKLGKIIGNADSYVALLWASLVGLTSAILITVGGRIMRLPEAMTTTVTGFKTMIPAVLILTMAWSLASTTEELHTATYLSTALQNAINPYLMPVLIFILAAAISFSTGSSWSTMAILYPIAIPTAWNVCMAQGMDIAISTEILLNVIAVVLAASVLGDHCSPISDTTILSSLASDCNHIEHVRTQLPYALTVGAVSVVTGGLATWLGGSWFISFLLLLAGIGVMYGIIRRFGKLVDDPE